MDTKELYVAHDAEIEETLANLPDLDPIDGRCEMCFAPIAYTILNDQKLCRGCYHAVTQFDLATENTQVCCICGSVLGEVESDEPTSVAGCANCTSGG